MGKRALVKFIIFYLILITLAAVALGVLLSVRLKPSQLYICADSTVSENPNNCPIELYFEEVGDKTIYLNVEPGKEFERCVLNLSGSALENNISFDIGGNGNVDYSLQGVQTIKTNSLDGWSKGQSAGNTSITISSDAKESHSINHTFQNANVSWIQYNFGKEIDATKLDKITFWSKCINYSNPSEDFGRWNIHFYDSSKDFICNILDYDIQDEDGTWKYHSNDICSEMNITDIKSIKIFIDQSHSMNATCLYSDFKLVGSQLAELVLDSWVLNEHIKRNENDQDRVAIKISISGSGNLVVKPACSTVKTN